MQMLFAVPFPKKQLSSSEQVSSPRRVTPCLTKYGDPVSELHKDHAPNSDMRSSKAFPSCRSYRKFDVFYTNAKTPFT